MNNLTKCFRQINKSDAQDKSLTDIIPDDSRQKAAKFFIESLSPEEKLKFAESLKNDSKKDQPK